VTVQSSAVAEVEVLTDPHRLDAYGLSLSDLVAAISAGNALQSVGRVQDNDKLYLVVSNSDLRQLDALQQLVVKSGASGVVRLVTSQRCATASSHSGPRKSKTQARCSFQCL